MNAKLNSLKQLPESKGRTAALAYLKDCQTMFAAFADGITTMCRTLADMVARAELSEIEVERELHGLIDWYSIKHVAAGTLLPEFVGTAWTVRNKLVKSGIEVQKQIANSGGIEIARRGAAGETFSSKISMTSLTQELLDKTIKDGKVLPPAQQRPPISRADKVVRVKWSTNDIARRFRVSKDGDGKRVLVYTPTKGVEYEIAAEYIANWHEACEK